MAENNISLQNQSLISLHAALDPKSLILSQFFDSHQPQFLQLTTDSFITERGPRYNEYSDLRSKRLQTKNQTLERDEKLYNRSILTPPKKQVKFNSNFVTPPKRPKTPSAVLTQSVPDFSSVLRKENRKPKTPLLPPVAERSVTPPSGLLKSGKMYGKVGGGSKSTNSVEKKSGGVMGRKSYVNLEELKGLAAITRSPINGENRGGVGRRIGKTVLGSRQFY